MAELTNGTVTNLHFNAHEGANLITQVAKVIILIFPRGLLIAGFNATGDILMIRYTEHKHSLPTWILDFYEHSFIDDNLLQNPEKVAGIFIASEKYLLVPNELYTEHDADDWLRKIYFVEANEMVDRYRLHDDNGHYLFAYPNAIKNLVNRYFHQTPIMPLATYQFYKPYRMESMLQCCISADQVFATLYKNRNLAWHQVFSYTTAEDIAYQIQLMSKQYRIDSQNMEMQAAVIHKDLNHVIADLTQYFPKLKFGNNEDVLGSVREWYIASHLLEQLYSCVS